MKKYSIPKGIEKEAAEYIQGVLAELENRGVLENIDNAALDMLARNYSTFQGIQTVGNRRFDSYQ